MSAATSQPTAAAAAPTAASGPPGARPSSVASPADAAAAATAATSAPAPAAAAIGRGGRRRVMTAHSAESAGPSRKIVTSTAADGFPFDDSDASRQPWVVFCADDATRDELVAAASELDASADPVAPGPGVVYWNPVKGTTVDTPFAKLLAKVAYKSRTTNRNLRTVRRILG